MLDSLNAVAERIAEYIDAELDPSAQGGYIVANTEHQVFEPLALGLPIETAVHAGPTPVLTPLAKTVDDHPAYMVLLAGSARGDPRADPARQAGSQCLAGEHRLSPPDPAGRHVAATVPGTRG